MRTRPLLDEAPTRQQVQCQQLGADLYVDEDDDTDEPSFGADPFDILAHREELGQSNHD